jgi:hypothetical protein
MTAHEHFIHIINAALRYLRRRDPTMPASLDDTWHNFHHGSTLRRVLERLEELRFYDKDNVSWVTDYPHVTGNWNEPTEWHPKLKEHITVDPSGTLHMVGEHLERHGFELIWYDEYDECSECYTLLRTQPDSYCWEPEYINTAEGYRVCNECAAKEPAYLEDYYNDFQKALFANHPFDLEELGFAQLNEDSWETGYHHGMDGDPKKVTEHLHASEVTNHIFVIDEVSQFYTKWSVWIPKDELHKVNIQEADTKMDVSPAAALDHALRTGEGMVTKTISQEAINRCPTHRLDGDHYNDDGTKCKCVI